MLLVVFDAAVSASNGDSINPVILRLFQQQNVNKLAFRFYKMTSEFRWVILICWVMSRPELLIVPHSQATKV